MGKIAKHFEVDILSILIKSNLNDFSTFSDIADHFKDVSILLLRP